MNIECFNKRLGNNIINFIGYNEMKHSYIFIKPPPCCYKILIKSKNSNKIKLIFLISNSINLHFFLVYV